MLTQSALKKALLINLLFGYALIAANPETTRATYKQELSSCSRIRVVRHLANYGYLYVLAATTAVVGIFAHRNAKRNLAQRLAELQKLGFTNAEKMANAMSGSSVQSLKSLVAADISLEDAKAINKKYPYQIIENILFMMKNKAINLAKAIDYASTYPDRSILLTIREKASQGPEAVANLLADMTKANIELKKAHINAAGRRDAAHITAQAHRDATWLQRDAARFNNNGPTRASVILQGNDNIVRI